MFGRLFGRKGNRENAVEHPVAHLKAGAVAVIERLLPAMQDERGVHIESVLGALGSLAGYCCIDSAVKRAAGLGQGCRAYGIMDVETNGGSLYYFGDPVNHLLAGRGLSLHALVAGIVDHYGCRDVPDFDEIAGHVAMTVGGAQFGIPRMPDQHRPARLPIDYVRDLAHHIMPVVERHAPVLEERVTLFGFAIQNVIGMGQGVIPADVAGKLVMECAVPMARIDPAIFGSSYPGQDSLRKPPGAIPSGGVTTPVRPARRGRFFRLTASFRGNGEMPGIEVANEAALVVRPGYTVEPPNGDPGQYAERPRLVHVPEIGGLPRDFEILAGIWIVSDALRQVFEAIDPQGFAFVPCDFILADGAPGSPYHFCNVVRWIDALDETASRVKIEYERDHQTGEYARFFSIAGGASLAFDETIVGDAHVFRQPRLGVSAICDHVLADALRAAGLEGIDLRDAAEL
jgi:hypothetical protein